LKDSSLGISCLAWAPDHEDVTLWEPWRGEMPKQLLELLLNPAVTLVAWNSVFECGVLKHACHLDIPLSRFRDPMILARGLALPGKLDSVAKILKMVELKDPRGDALKMMFCKPVSKGGELTLFGIAPPLFRDHNSHPKEFAEYGEYCMQDVRTERDLWYRLAAIPFPEREWQGWLLDAKINAFGMPGRRDLAEKGLRMAQKFITARRQLLKEKTGLENPNSDLQMKAWIKARGYPWESLRAPTVKAELANPDSMVTPECREALQLRSAARKSSYTKLQRFIDILSADDRLRYQFRYFGAPRTGRWASGGGEEAAVQVQNFSRGEKAVKKKLALALELWNNEDYEGIEKEFTNTPDPKDSVTVVEFVITMLRSLFHAKSGKKLIVADKNAIENRMLGWASGCSAILEVFKHSKEDGGDPYIAFACHLFSMTYAALWAEYAAGNEEHRQQAKAPVLAGGYGLGGGEMHRNSDGDMVRGGMWGYALNVCGVDMPKEMAHRAVKTLRAAWPEVVQFWTDLEEAFKQVLTKGGIVKVGQVTWDKKQRAWVEHPTKGKRCVITFTRKKMVGGGYMISMTLPSGRALRYLNATIEEEQRIGKRDGEPYTVHTIYYDGIEHSATQDADGKTLKQKHKWGRVKTYGGKLCENAIQAMSRDDFLESMFLADDMGFNIWGLFHDELATEEGDVWDGLCLQDLIDCMTVTPKWAPGLPLGADGWEGQVYRK